MGSQSSPTHGLAEDDGAGQTLPDIHDSTSDTQGGDDKTDPELFGDQPADLELTRENICVALFAMSERLREHKVRVESVPISPTFYVVASHPTFLDFPPLRQSVEEVEFLYGNACKLKDELVFEAMRDTIDYAYSKTAVNLHGLWERRQIRCLDHLLDWNKIITMDDLLTDGGLQGVRIISNESLRVYHAPYHFQLVTKVTEIAINQGDSNCETECKEAAIPLNLYLHHVWKPYLHESTVTEWLQKYGLISKFEPSAIRAALEKVIKTDRE